MPGAGIRLAPVQCPRGGQEIPKPRVSATGGGADDGSQGTDEW